MWSILLLGFLASAVVDPVLQKAQDATLAKNRQLASRTLVTAIQSEKPGSPNSKKWIRSLNDLTEIFYTERAQKLFLEAEGQPFDQGRSLIDQLEEIRTLEPGNIRVYRALISARLVEKECSTADRLITDAMEVNPYSQDLYVLRFQTLLCLGKIAEAKDWSTKNSDHLKNIKSGPELMGLWLAAAKNQWPEVKRRALEIQSLDSNNPEIIYWGLKSDAFMERTRLEMASRYLNLCQKNYVQVRKSYSWIPMVCSQKKDVEDMRGKL